MRTGGYVLIGFALIVGLSATLLRQANGGELPETTVIVGIAMLVGLFLLSVAATIRLAKGEVRLRPLDAARSALTLFIIIMGVRLLSWAVFPSLTRNWTEALIHAFAFAIGVSLYTTAYRKPA